MHLLRNGLLMRKTGNRRRTELTETFAFLCGFSAELIARSRLASLEAAPICWQLFMLGSSQSDCTAFLLFLVTRATCLLAPALNSVFFTHFVASVPTGSSVSIKPLIFCAPSPHP
jgi:hypothetical protein